MSTMIDPGMFTVEGLLEALLDIRASNIWRNRVEIIPDYMPPFPRPDTRPKCVVRYRDSFLRYSCGPVQGYFWDLYGDDFKQPEWALVAIASAPVPPVALRSDVWESPSPTAAGVES